MDLKLDYILVVTGFYALAFWTFLAREMRASALRRTWGEWALDVVGLTIHGVVVPAFQTSVIFVALGIFFPGARSSLHWPEWAGFLVSFVGVDYLYYWNHRLLHSPFFWRWHFLHHSSESMDVFATSRNSAITSFFILYVWVNGFFLYFLDHKEGYVIGVALTNFLDILRHSRLSWWPRFAPFSWVVSPRDHAWHHSTDIYEINYSGNFNLWDRFHGTYHVSDSFPQRTGFSLKGRRLMTIFLRGGKE